MVYNQRAAGNAQSGEAKKQFENNGKNISRKLCLLFLFLSASHALFSQDSCRPVLGVQINTSIPNPPLNPVISTAILSKQISAEIAQFINIPKSCNTNIKIVGRIERTSPSFFSITTSLGYVPLTTFTSGTKTPITITATQQLDAFGGFNENNLTATGVDLASLRDTASNGLRLPDGNYRICFIPYYVNPDSSLGSIASDPNIGCAVFTVACRPPNIGQFTTNIVKPVSPLIGQTVEAEGISVAATFGSLNPVCATSVVKVVGRIERLSPSPFTITINAGYTPTLTYKLGSSLNLDGDQQLDAFGNFLENNLATSGISLASLLDPVNPSLIKLPDGNYRICYQAHYVNFDGTLGGPASDPNLGCSSFSISCQPPNGVGVVTTLTNPNVVSLAQTIESGGIQANLQYSVKVLPECNTRVKVIGTIERLTPSPFKINLNPSSNLSIYNYGINTQLTTSQQLEAFGNFTPTNLVAVGVDLATLQDPSNPSTIKLPDGTYRICFESWYLNPDGTLGGFVFDPTVSCATFAIACQPPNGVQVNTSLTSAIVNPYITQIVRSGSISAGLQASSIPAPCNTQVKVIGRIERLSPPAFTLTVNPGFVPSESLSVSSPVQLTPAQQLDAFGAFDESNLVATGIALASLRDPLNPSVIKLPDGNYRICYQARYINADRALGGNASDANLGCATFNLACQPVNAVQVSTIARTPASSSIAQTIAGGGISTTLQSSNFNSVCNTQVKIIGKLERISPSPFSITISQSYIPSQTVTLAPSVQLTPAQQLDAFGNFIESRLAATGIDLASLRDPFNPSELKLPDGNYRICFSALYINNDGSLGGPASDANLGCALFALCTKAGSAPQFTQPVNSLNVMSSAPTITPTSPVVFTWTPPQFICGSPRAGIQYDLEIRELLDNQTITDAFNNPFVFRKTGLPSTTFILDTNLNRNVLHVGRKYAIRVKANYVTPLDTFEIENNGFSRVEAFQYGNDPTVLVSTPFPVRPPEDYYIPFGQRKTDSWNDVYNAFKNGTGRDTAVPLKEYIALNLIQNGIAYNLDAIELFMALNPELAGLKEVHLSNHEKLPVFPEVNASEQQKFTERHSTNLTPDSKESSRFKLYLDSLNKMDAPQGLPKTTAQMTRDVLTELNAFDRNVSSINRVSVHLLTDLLAELLYNLRQNANKRDDNHIQNVVATIQELMVNTTNSTSSLSPTKKQFPVSTVSTAFQVTLAGYAMINKQEKFPFAEEGTLLPFQVVVWRGSTDPPARPITNAPGLTGVYRIFYAAPAQYNHKNPEVGSVTLPDLASTSQVSLPKLSALMFWTMNLTNHQLTNAQTIETKDVIELNKKNKWSASKKLYIVLKVQ